MSEKEVRFKVCSRAEWVSYVERLQYAELPGTNGNIKLALPGRPLVKIEVMGRVHDWPEFFTGETISLSPCSDQCFFSRALADDIVQAGCTGIEFHPVELDFIVLKSLERKIERCPEYLWGRISGVVLADYCVDGVPIPTDPTGLYYTPGSIPSSLNVKRRRRFRDEQREKADFARMMPATRGTYFVLGERAYEVMRRYQAPPDKEAFYLSPIEHEFF